MKMKLSYFFILPSFLTLRLTSAAQTSNQPPERMKMLAAFNGTWKGEMIEMINGKKVKTKISHTSMKVASGWAVQVSETANLPDKSKYTSVKIFSYSPSGDTTYMYVVDNKGATYFYTGTWRGTRHLDLTWSSKSSDDKMLRKEIAYDFKNMREYDYKYTSAKGDSVEKVIEMNMLKE